MACRHRAARPQIIRVQLAAAECPLLLSESARVHSAHELPERAMPHPSDERCTELLEPVIADLLAQASAGRFSTRRLIDALRSIPFGDSAYVEAEQILAEEGHSENMVRQILHGQVIPDILRRSPSVRFRGYIHGEPDEDDGYGIPSWWEKL